MDLMKKFPVDVALATMRADNMNNVIAQGDSLTIKGITAHKAGTHEKLDDIEGLDNADFYFRVAGALKADGKPSKRVQVAISSIFQAKVSQNGTTVNLLDHLRGEEGTTLDMSKLKDMEVIALQPVAESNLDVIDTLKDTIKVAEVDDAGKTLTTKIPARFAMTDHKGYVALKKVADAEKTRVNYAESAKTGIMPNAKPLRNLVVTLAE